MSICHTLLGLTGCDGQDFVNDHMILTLFGQWDTLFLNLIVEDRYKGVCHLVIDKIPKYKR